MTQYSISTSFNKPTLTADGCTVAPVLYGLSDFPAASSASAYAQKNIAAFADAGISLVNIDTELRLGWHKTTPFDAEPMLCEVANVLDANPNARVLIRLHVNPPYWWMRDNPEECVLYRTGHGDVPGVDDGDHERLIAHDLDNHIRVSLASEKWLTEASEMLSLLCRAFAENEEGKAVFGIQIACGLYGEWHKWGCNDDVSRPARERFQRFLREKYGTDEALAAAWHSPGVTLDTAEYHPERFGEGDEGFFLDPRLSQCKIDSRECTQIIPSDAILRFCRTVKEHLPHVLAGAFYGYYLNTTGDHLKVERLYQSKDVDFICGPFCYLDNRKPQGIPMQRGLLESARLRGMLWLTEMDQHPLGLSPIGGGDPEQYPLTVSILQRNILQPLLAGQGVWYYDHRVIPTLLSEEQKKDRRMAGSIYRKSGWWDCPTLMEKIAQLQKLAAQITERKYEAAADVLIVYDKQSHYYRIRTWPQENQYLLHEAVARCGVAYDCIYTDELEAAELSRYKCVIFADAYMISPAQRAKYRALLRQIKTLWLGAAGYCDGSTLSTDNLSETVGMRFTKTENKEHLCFRGEQIPAIGYHAPHFAVIADADTTPLARYENGEIAAAIRGNDIYFPFPAPSRAFMEQVFTLSGVHVYCDRGEAILAGAGIVAIVCIDGGDRTVQLKNGRRVTLSLPPYTTAAVDAESGERLL